MGFVRWGGERNRSAARLICIFAARNDTGLLSGFHHENGRRRHLIWSKSRAQRRKADRFRVTLSDGIFLSVVIYVVVGQAQSTPSPNGS